MEISEDNFIHKLKLKNEEALSYILDQYGWIIKSTVKKHLYNLESLQGECINDILMAVWHNIHSFDENRSEFKNWLAGVAKYKCIDYKRKHLKNLGHEDVNNLEISVEDNSFNSILNKELNKDLESILNCLKKEDKDLFLKLYLEEKEMDQVCFETGMKREVIYNRLSRAKKKIKSVLNIKESRV